MRAKSITIGKEAEKNVNFLYILETLNKEFVKVGIARNVILRVTGLQTNCPFPIRLRTVVLCPTRASAEDMELMVHRLLGKFSVRGGRSEWFHYSRAIDLIAGFFNESTDLEFWLEDLDRIINEIPNPGMALGKRWQTSQHEREAAWV